MNESGKEEFEWDGGVIPLPAQSCSLNSNQLLHWNGPFRKGVQEDTPTDIYALRINNNFSVDFYFTFEPRVSLNLLSSGLVF